MSTNARIGIYVPATEGVRSIYLHWDGYPESPGAGATLLAHYTEDGKVKELIELGNLSSLSDEIGEFVEKRREKEQAAFPERPYEKWCFSYKRDDRNENEEPRDHSQAEWPDDYGCTEWEYLFTPGSGWVGREVLWSSETVIRRPWMSLAKLVEQETRRVEAMS